MSFLQLKVGKFVDLVIAIVYFTSFKGLFDFHFDAIILFYSFKFNYKNVDVFHFVSRFQCFERRTVQGFTKLCKHEVAVPWTKH